MKYTLILIFWTLLIGVSCNRDRQRDFSLTIEEYQKMGIPDPSKVWNTDELGAAISVLSGIKWSEPYTLPRKDSEKSGVLFDRMVNLDNMGFLQDDALKNHEKAFLAMQFLQNFEQWKDVYSHPMWKKQYYHRELVDININEVRVTEKMVELTKKIMVSEDPYDIALQSGVPQVKANYVSSLVNAMDLQSHISQFLENDMELLADSLSDSILRNRDWMDSISTDRLRRSIDVVLDSTSSEYVRKKYEMIAGELK